ncbi:RagB/SusD family nutrient uptake outer membrane protein [Lutibacter sp. A80]|uniref:RagB/SusD family nutrient uptake outer membrane protein n=1 Tax=Lutibacter sp. A80 TaxID=2918453 RepID=UPI001F067694|nr:RagB/SusD family nutrient uptake outer membrane protein [Lutibacter sp. A80]UMB62021.1 RagB/SusD family nutrient uptake outer membrane protein [Lutibacter sp. A80]
MKKLFYISLIALVFGVSSCADDVLDLSPSYKLNEKNGITDKVKARAAVNGIYTTVVSGNNYSGGINATFISKSGFGKWITADYEMEYTQSNITTTSIKYKWIGYYETINAANFAITGISSLSESQIDEAEKNSLLGEAKVLRAFANAYILWVYGHWWAADDADPNGILFRDDLVTVANLRQPRLTVGESYEKIYEDLDFAIEHLNSFTDNRFVSKEFAKVFKAKVMLYRAGFNDGIAGLDEALSLVNEVLNASVSGFSMQGDLAQVYQDSWDSEENLFSGYLEETNRANNASSYYNYTIPYRYSTRLPVAEGTIPSAGLTKGIEWFQTDPRWPIVTGESRSAITWDTNQYYCFTKVTRLGKVAGLEQGDNKYNTYFFRYPELYIMKAELLARTGASISEAIAPINIMRSKRTNPILPSLNPTTQQELTDAIFKEYFLETFLENGSEYFASTRFKDSAGQLWIENLREAPIVLNSLCYPIPLEEINVNNEIVQNTDLE